MAIDRVSDKARSPFADQSAIDANGLRRLNRRMVLEAIWARDETSRIQIRRETKLSASTVSSIVNELVEAGYVVETGTAESARGRKPIVLKLRPQAATVVGIDLNALTGCVFDLDGRACGPYIALPKREGIEPGDVAALVESLMVKLPNELPKPVRIGISVPGRVDIENGRVLFSSSLDWSDVPLAQIVTAATGLPAIVESDVICLALNEAWAGAARGLLNFVYLYVGWRGVGAGIVLNGQVVRGAHFNAGEVGHLHVDPGGPLCHCGRRGCLEAVASGRAIARRAQGHAADPPSMPPVLQNPADFDDVVRAARQGDAAARRALEDGAAALARGVTALVTLVDPELLVVGGSCMTGADIILPALRRALGERAAFFAADELRIHAIDDAEQKSAMGAARIAAHRLMLEA